MLPKRQPVVYERIDEYIRHEFGDRVADIFEQKTKDFLDLLITQPEMGSLESNKKGIRGFQLTKQTKVFYRISNKKIVILTFFHVRQHPQKSLNNQLTPT